MIYSERVRQAVVRHGERFIRRILSPLEWQEIAGASSPRQLEFVTGRFAAKEAMSKALGCGIGRLNMSAVTIAPSELGLTVTWSPHRTWTPTGERWHVSISHDSGIAFAIAIRESL